MTNTLVHLKKPVLHAEDGWRVESVPFPKDLLTSILVLMELGQDKNARLTENVLTLHLERLFLASLPAFLTALGGVSLGAHSVQNALSVLS